MKLYHDVYECIIKGLKVHNLIFEEFTHAPMKTVEDANRILGIEDGNGTKTVVVKSKEKIFVITVLDNEMVNFKYIKELLKLKKLSMIKPDELFEKLNIELGGVSPLGYASNIETYIAENVFDKPELYINPGKNYLTIKLSGRNLRHLASTMNVVSFNNSPNPVIE